MGNKIEKLDSKQVYNVIKNLIGKVQPRGETNYDKIAFENLKVLTEVTTKLICDIDEVAYNNKDRHEASIKKAGDLANKWCKEHLAE